MVSRRWAEVAVEECHDVCAGAGVDGEGDALLGEQPLEKGEIGFPILRSVRAGRVRAR